MKAFNPRLAALRCFACDLEHDPADAPGLCVRCGRPLRADYELGGAEIDAATSSLWRYRELLPTVRDEVTLGEGWSPLVEVGAGRWVKDESLNPTGSFKARGMSVAISVVRALGADAVMAPSAGNAGLAMAVYGAAAGLEVTVAMPLGTPESFVSQSRDAGAEVHVVGDSIAASGAWLLEHGPSDAFDLSTMKEPYRLEGKKTMAYELFEQLDALPTAVVYPTGGGTGLVGMWKAYEEMERLGWISAAPRLVAVQPEGCAPVVRAFRDGADEIVPWQDPATAALGLRVPAPIGGFLCLRAIRRTGGTAVTVSEAELAEGMERLQVLGFAAGPEAGAAWAGLDRLVRERWIEDEEPVVVFNTGGDSTWRR